MTRPAGVSHPCQKNHFCSRQTLRNKTHSTVSSPRIWTSTSKSSNKEITELINRHSTSVAPPAYMFSMEREREGRRVKNASVLAVRTQLTGRSTTEGRHMDRARWCGSVWWRKHGWYLCSFHQLCSFQESMLDHVPMICSPFRPLHTDGADRYLQRGLQNSS